MKCRGPAPTGSRETLRRNGVGEENDVERDKERMLQIRKQRREKRLIFLDLHRKPIKPRDKELAPST